MTSAAGTTNVRALRRSAADASDGELIVRIGWGDREAFELLYRRFARPVLGLALHRLGDRGRAEDAVQETFAKVWRRAVTYRPERGPGAPWLYGVARHAIADQGRARLEPVSEPPDTADDDPGPPELVESEWVSWRVHSAVETLSQDERVLIELAYWKGLSQSEIATHLGIPLGTVKTRTRRTLARLAQLLDDQA
jgi:RNA polymerase sigma-70 factor, ECF subfamily